MSKQPLGAMLVEAGVIKSSDLQVVLEAQRQMPSPLGSIVVDLGFATEEEVLPILAMQLCRKDVVLSEKTAVATVAGSVTDALQYVFEQAIESEATDIHFEPTEDSANVRLRIDGILREVDVPTLLRQKYPSAVSRIKVLAGLDIAEKRMPQEGRASIKLSDKKFDFRISILPSRYGESIVIRVLQSEIPIELSNLGMNDKTLSQLKHLLDRRSGLILVTGPTGFGKTTTLYACLKWLNDSSRKIVTIEDPVEYTLDDAVQMQVMPQIGLDFSRMLKTVLRHDPNIIMVGEIRDKETAEVAIRTALTGHLVLSTLHTNDAASTVARLLDMGVDPYLVSSSLSCSIAQRLVRTVCPECEGERCVTCFGLGLKGRTGVFECLTMDEELRKLVLQNASVDEIRAYARVQGMQTLFEDGMEKVRDGITTKEELERAIQEDELR